MVRIFNSRLWFLYCILFFIESCSIRPVRKAKHITYDSNHKLQLNVFSPLRKKDKREVIIFIHGGNWVHGKKSLYSFLGKGMARKGFVAAVIDYRLSPVTDYKGMAMDAAEAVKWVKENITQYGGDPNKIFVSGHSAGAHLAALIATDNHYFDSLHMTNPIRGSIMIDAFGLDMYSYLKDIGPNANPVHLAVFSTDPETWKKGSPLFHLHKQMPPFLIFYGTRTYPAIINGSKAFSEEVKKFQPGIKLIPIKRKHHATMIFNYVNPFNKGYKEITAFIRTAQ
jgi:dipeptidyl aminopeptidase/acylaminoacyl peptidase